MQLTDDLLSQAVMMVEDSRPTLAINLAGARQHWLEGMLRHEIGQRGGAGGCCEHPWAVTRSAAWGPQGEAMHEAAGRVLEKGLRPPGSL